MKMNISKIIPIISAVTLSVGTLITLSACNTSTTEEKVSDGAEEVDEDKVSEDVKDGDGDTEDSTEKD